MLQDPFQSQLDTATAPAQNCFVITPNDAQDLSYVTKGIYVGEGGNVSILALRGETPVIFTNVPSGAILDVRAKKILATNTTAANIIGLV